MPVVLDNDPGHRAALYGYDSAAWQKLPLLWGYTSRLADRKSDTNAAAGTNTLTSSTPAAGEIWVVTHIAAEDVTSAITRIVVYANMDAVNLDLFTALSPGGFATLDRQGQWILAAGDTIRAEFVGCTLGDDIYLTLLGYKMGLAL